MKIKQLCILFLFTSFFIFGQKKDCPIKVFLEDAETGKNISDAKVTLEGFEIPAIPCKYDKEIKCYYSDVVPKGYNTVMIYHEKYNEKGFQDVDGLPKKLKIQLYEQLSMSYSFEKPYISIDNCCTIGKKTNYSIMPKYLKKAMKSKKKIRKKTFKYLYEEDPNHIAIFIPPNQNKGSLKKLLDNLFLEEINYNDFGTNRYALDSEEGCLSDGSIANNEANIKVMILKKKDGTKFGRFNSREIKGLREQNFIVACLTNRTLEYYANVDFNANTFYGGQFFYFSLFAYPRNTDQSFSSTRQEDYKMYYGNGPDLGSSDLPSSNEYRMTSVFFVISNIKNDGIGLGLIDNMCIAGSMCNSYIFTNNYKYQSSKK